MTSTAAAVHVDGARRQRTATCDAQPARCRRSATTPTLPRAGGVGERSTARQPGPRAHLRVGPRRRRRVRRRRRRDARHARSPAGTRKRVRVRATDEDGRIGEATRRCRCTSRTSSRRPAAYGRRRAARASGSRVTVSVYGFDRRRHGRPHRARRSTATGPTRSQQADRRRARRRSSSTTVTFATAGERTVRARVHRRRRRDDRRDRVRSTSTPQNIAPVGALSSSLDVARAGQPSHAHASGHATPTARSSRCDLRPRRRRHVRDRQRTPTGQRDDTASPTAGTKLVGVRVTDDDGATATSRRTIEVKRGQRPAERVHLPHRARPHAATRLRATRDGAIAQYAWDLDDDGVFDDLVGQRDTTTFPAGVYGTRRGRAP